MLLVGGKVDFFSPPTSRPAVSLAANYTSLQFPAVSLPLFARPGYRLPLQPSFNPIGSLEIPVFINFRPVGARDRCVRARDYSAGEALPIGCLPTVRPNLSC